MIRESKLLMSCNFCYWVIIFSLYRLKINSRETRDKGKDVIINQKAISWCWKSEEEDVMNMGFWLNGLGLLHNLAAAHIRIK